MKADVTVIYDEKGRLRASPVVLTSVDLDLDAGGNAIIFGGSGRDSRLQHAAVVLISRDGLLIRGFEEISIDRFVRQDWWVRPAASVKATSACTAPQDDQGAARCSQVGA